MCAEGAETSQSSLGERRCARAGCRAVRDSTLVAWYRCIYAPRTGGAYDSHHRTAGIAGCTWRRGGHVAARGSAQQPAMPGGGFIRDGSADAHARNVAAFRKGINETGTVEGQNVTVEYYWLEGRHDRLPALMADLARRQVAVIATAGNVPALAAKAATATTPIVFGIGDDPVSLVLWPALP